MTLRDQLPIPPLSDISRRRIRDSVFEALDREAPTIVDPRPLDATQLVQPRRRRWAPAMAVAGVAMAAAAAIMLTVWSRDDQSRPEIAAGEPSRVVTGPASSEFTLGAAALEVAAESAVVVSGDEGRGYLAVLERGGLSGRIEARTSSAPFRVQAGDVRVEVLRSRFAIFRHGDAARVRVDSGTVRVTYRGELLSVTAGETWAPDGVSLDDGHDSSSASRAPDGPRSITVAPGRRTAGKHHRRSRRSRRSRIDRDADVDVPSADADIDTAADEGAEEPVEPVVAEPTDKDRYEEAARLEASQPRAAIAIYRELEAKTGPWAANALFAHGRLEWERGNRDTAERLLRAYLRRFPRGNNARVARKLLREAE